MTKATDIPGVIQEKDASDEELKDFQAGFSDDGPAPIVKQPQSALTIDESLYNNLDEPPAVTTEPPAAAATPDPWEGVTPAVKQMIEGIQKQTGETTQYVKSQLGRLEKIQGMLDKATTDATAAGAKVPSKKTVIEALKDGEKFKLLEQEYSEFADSLSEAIGIHNTRIQEDLQGMKAGIKTELLAELGPNVTDADVINRLEPVIPLYTKHPSWKKTIATEEFNTFLVIGGPSMEQFKAYKAAQKDATASNDANKPALLKKADELLRLMETNHPDWWKDKGSKYCSDDPDDAITILDQYEASKKKKQTKSERHQDNQRQLEESVVPDTKAARTTHIDSEEEDFLAGYNS